jgi:hypothetical protein
MTRLEATRVIVDVAGGAAIVASLGHPAYDLFAAADRPRNFYTWGSMGLASSIGLGLALARPDVRVFVLDGDGSLLMNLGSLATIGLLRPANLIVVVMDNEEYATRGPEDADGARRRPRRRRAGDGRAGDGDGGNRNRTGRCGAPRDATGSRRHHRQGERVAAHRETAARLRVHQAAVHGRARASRARHLGSDAVTLAGFVATAAPPAAARSAAARALLDTIGVTLAGASQPAARIVQRVIEADGRGPCRVLGTALCASAGNAALANGTAAHALDYDDIFVSPAPSAPLVAAALAAGRRGRRVGPALLDAYVVGFEIEGRPRAP